MNGYLAALLWAAACVLLILAGGFFAGLSAARVAANRFRVRYGPQHAGGPRLRRVLELFDDPRRVQSVSIIGSTLAAVGALLAMIFLLRALEKTPGAALDAKTAALAWVLAIPLILVFGELVPQRLLRRLDNRLVFALYHPMRWALAALGGLGRAGLWLVRRAAGCRGDEELPADLLAPGEPWQSLLEPEPPAEAGAAPRETSERQMISGIFNLEKTRVREVMRPLVDLIVVHLPEHAGAVHALARQTGYSRFPVYFDRITNLTGYLDLYDLLAADPPDEQSVDEFVREALYVPETKRLDALLPELLQGHHRVAIVVDEYGGCSGWVTREDLLEEIVGEIEDEFDEAAEPVRRRDDGAWRVLGTVHIDDVNEKLGLRLPSSEFDTLAGFVYDSLGRIPRVGDAFEENGVRYEVAEMDRRRIVAVTVTLPSGELPPNEAR